MCVLDGEGVQERDERLRIAVVRVGSKKGVFFSFGCNFVLFGRVFFLLHDPVRCAKRVGLLRDKITCDSQSPKRQLGLFGCSVICRMSED